MEVYKIYGLQPILVDKRISTYVDAQGVPTPMVGYWLEICPIQYTFSTKFS